MLASGMTAFVESGRSGVDECRQLRPTRLGLMTQIRKILRSELEMCIYADHTGSRFRISAGSEKS